MEVMFRLLVANKYKVKNQYKSYEVFTWAKTKKELKEKLETMKKDFFKQLKKEKIEIGKINYGIMEVEYNKELLGKTIIKNKVFFEGGD